MHSHELRTVFTNTRLRLARGRGADLAVRGRAREVKGPLNGAMRLCCNA